MTTDQIDFVKALRTVSDGLADYAADKFREGASFDEVQSQFNRCVDLVKGWRIGRNV